MSPSLETASFPTSNPSLAHPRLPKKTKLVQYRDLRREDPQAPITSSSAPTSGSSALTTTHPSPIPGYVTMANPSTYYPTSTPERMPFFDSYSTSLPIDPTFSASWGLTSNGYNEGPENSDINWTQNEAHPRHNPLLNRTSTQSQYLHLPHMPIPTLPYPPITTDPRTQNLATESTVSQLPCLELAPMTHLPRNPPLPIPPLSLTPLPPFRTSLDCSTTGSQTQLPMPRLAQPSTPVETRESNVLLTNTSRLQRQLENEERNWEDWRWRKPDANEAWELSTGIDGALQVPLSVYAQNLSSSPTSFLQSDYQLLEQHLDQAHPVPSPTNQRTLSPKLLAPITRTPQTLTPPEEVASLSASSKLPLAENSPPRHLTDLPVTPIQAEWEAAFKFLETDTFLGETPRMLPTTMQTAPRLHRFKQSAVPRRDAQSLPYSVEATMGLDAGSAEMSGILGEIVTICAGGEQDFQTEEKETPFSME